ncbi:Iron transport multicopper oxidase FET3 [Cyphellophora attinorum]|uniref:Iron transport multicopper oxidase FET3 n=1 Tax=Cyphellophora attinorum TaxID=1664694 RepID=A0A0N1HM55_9EURO|nr:Iron transport multicopper oxidase FET3 [Phialophora attinorum]KPI38272.1 Iron transport multicopper oxidase FET3 [Phialophora attinorum]
MNGTSQMDGTSYVSQCAVPPGSSFVYNFKADQAGTYWYHSHEKSQYPDGLRGMMVISDPEDPYKAQYDQEIVISISDWYHGQMPDLLLKFDQPDNRMRDITPDSNLINDTVGAKFEVVPERTYLVRLANIGGFVGQYFWIQNHAMTLLAEDEAKEDATANFPIVSRMDTGSFSSHVPWPKNLDAVAWLTYDTEADFPDPDVLEDKESAYALDDMALEPLDKQPLLEPVDRTLAIDIDMKTQEDGIIHWLFNTISYRTPTLPSLFAALATGPEATDPKSFERSTQTFVMEHGQIIEVTMNNKHMWKHPLHLHGHNFQVTKRTKGLVETTPEGRAPMRRDTINVNGHGWVAFRFRADNPGVWLLHCHMEWHAHSGLKATFVEAPLQLQQRLRLSNVSATLDPSKACDPGRVQVISSIEESVGVFDGTDGLTRHAYLHPTPLLIAVIALICSLGLICAYLWRRSAGTQEGIYSRVPMVDIEENDKPNAAEPP